MNRDPPKSRRSIFVDNILRYARDDTYGYSQKPPSGRWGPDFDCSSLIYKAANDSGYNVGTGGDKVRFTGTMLKDFEKAGFQVLPFANVGISDLKIGDILLNLALHAEVYVGEGMSVGATSSEDGGYVGESGDQTGKEIEKHPVTTFTKEWDYILRPPNENEEDTETEEGDDMAVYNQPGQGLNGMYPPTTMPNQWMNGYPQGGMPNQGMNNMRQGYPQGNLGQMNGYSQANGGGYPQNGGYQQGMMPMGPQGQSQQMETDYCFVKGIEGARNSYGIPNSRKPLFDEDKCIFYAVTYGPQGTPVDIHPYKFMDDFESMEEMPQHLSPLMRNNQNGNMNSGGMNNTGDFITRAEFEELKEMMLGESVNEQQSNGATNANGRRNGGQQPNAKLNARTN